MSVKIGTVNTFTDVVPDKAQALKPLEEAAEVFGVWQAIKTFSPLGALFGYSRVELMNECADVIQSVCNLAASVGVDDLTPYMAACEERNRDRGRM